MDKITESLVALGTTAEEVAASLLLHGIKGDLDSPFRCPIAIYLNIVLNEGKDFTDKGWVRPVVDAQDVTVGEVVLPTPKAIQDFISLFDECKFPFLIGE